MTRFCLGARREESSARVDILLFSEAGQKAGEAGSYSDRARAAEGIAISRPVKGRQSPEQTTRSVVLNLR